MVINGKNIAAEILSGLKKRLAEVAFQPVLCDVLVGADPVSLSYVNIKEKTAKSIGIKFRLIQLPQNSLTGQVVTAIHDAQKDQDLCGLIVQLPLPDQMDREQVLNSIHPSVDVDVINPASNKRFYLNRGVMTPPTAGAVLYLLQSLHLPLSEMEFLVIGQGELVGKPVTHLLRHQGYSVVTADSSTKDLASLTKVADIVISGTGQGKLVAGPMLKPGAVVIDAGTSESGATIVGDVDLVSVEEVASAVSPVPGGVGPVTVAKLLENVVITAERKTL
jgi:methylenetetrahydrofolate dehydrogenase (NADP+)/methenyltetrahydrofolate cyclohydrolase